MKELGDKVEAGEKSRIEEAIRDLEAVMKGEDKATIESRTEALSAASAKMAERLYAQQGGETGAAGGGTHGEAGQGAGGPAKDNVVDAEFEEVKDNK
jgi:molecular chaperone DnaK